VIQVEEEETSNTNITVRMVDLMGNKRFFMAGCSATLGYFLYGFMEPILAFRVKDFHLTQF
jgi:hypothetical protein